MHHVFKKLVIERIKLQKQNNLHVQVAKKERIIAPTTIFNMNNNCKRQQEPERDKQNSTNSIEDRYELPEIINRCEI